MSTVPDKISSVSAILAVMAMVLVTGIKITVGMVVTMEALGIKETQQLLVH